jgi:hypothetical protein
VARNYTTIPKTRTVSVVDAALPAAPSDKGNQSVTPVPAGVYETAGAKLLQIDVGSSAGNTGNATLSVYAWNHQLQQWAFVQQVTSAVLPTGSVGTVATQATRTTIANWGADFAAVLVTALPTGGNPVTVTVSPTVEQR